MTVDTRPRQGGVSAASLDDTRVSPAIVYPGTVVTRNPRELKPLQCPPGFTPATPAQMADTVAPFVEAYIAANEVGGRPPGAPRCAGRARWAGWGLRARVPRARLPHSAEAAGVPPSSAMCPLPPGARAADGARRVPLRRRALLPRRL